MNVLGPRWGLFVLLPLTATGLSYGVARATAPAAQGDPPPITTTKYVMRVAAVTTTTVPNRAPLWRPLGIADALRQIAAVNCAYGDPAPIPRLGLGLHTAITSLPSPSCPGTWRTSTTSSGGGSNTPRLRVTHRAPATAPTTTRPHPTSTSTTSTPTTSTPTTSTPTTSTPTTEDH